MESSAIITTHRLLLRPLQLSDSNAMFAYRSLPEVYRYQFFAPKNSQDMLGFITKLANAPINTPGSWFQMGILLKESGDFIGDCGMHFPDDDSQQAEVGITLSPQFQGKGYATETLTALLNHLFYALDKHRVFASVDPRNQASIAMMERVGMRKEAHFRQSLWFKEEWLDDMVYAILKEEWQVAHPGDNQQA